jgi:ribonuclease III
MSLEFESRLGYIFRDKSLLNEALTHSTYANEHKSAENYDNQRLEFLGDTVVNATIARKVYLAFPDATEGRLTKLRAELINEAALVKVAMYIRIGEELQLGKGEELDRGSSKPSILADAYEAVIGAIFLDGSFDEASSVVESHFEQAIGNIEDIAITDFKSALIEYCQSKMKKIPEMVVEDESGPEHDKVFTLSVRLEGVVIGRGSGKTKKQASQEACSEALKSLRSPVNPRAQGSTFFEND